MHTESQIEQSYKTAKELYAGIGVDTDSALRALGEIPVSMHCWQGDDVVGFEKNAGGADGGILSTGNYPGRARNAAELRQDLDFAMSLLPGTLRVNLHAIYLESETPVDRAHVTPEHFENWIRWAKEKGIGLDFNPTFFSDPMMKHGMTLSSADPAVRNYWIEHGKACRTIAETFGRRLGKRCVMNIWVPDGFKDAPADRRAARARLASALDEMLTEKKDPALMRDAVESKLFGIGCESCTVGSHEFYMGYALSRGVMVCLDAGHFHPTESIADKISSVLLFSDELLLHVSRPVRWDSDHVIMLDDELQNIANEIVRNDPKRVNIGLDYFDGTINRIAAWVTGVRNMQKALCRALLEPRNVLAPMDDERWTERLVWSEELKALPWQAVYDYFCLKNNVPAGLDALKPIRDYERNVLGARA